MRTYIDYDSDTEGIDVPSAEEDPFGTDATSTEPCEIPTDIQGSENRKKQLTELCEEHKDIFSTKLRPEPANIPAYEIKCDIEKWHINKNRIVIYEAG
jgi:hypothetical protein